MIKKLLVIILLAATPLTIVLGQEGKASYLRVSVTNHKGKPFKNTDMYIYLNNNSGDLLMTTTDKNGEVLIENVRKGDTLNVIIDRYIYEIPLNDSEFINLVMKNREMLSGFKMDVKQPDINTGYGIIPLESNSLAANSVNTNELSRYNSIASYIRGRIPGVEIANGGILIRGLGSIASGTYALVVVDGVAMSFRDANSIYNPKDIASITVLKDGAIYGVRGANGVLVITTKK